MASIVQVNLNLNQQISDYFLNYILQNITVPALSFGGAINKLNYANINSLIYVPPANSQTLEILSDGAYFLPVGLTDFNDLAIEQVNQTQFLDVSTNKTVFLYSYFQKIVNIKISFDYE